MVAPEEKDAPRLGGDRGPASIVPPANNIPYIIAVVAMISVAFVCTVVISVMLPERDNMPLFSIIIGFLALTTLSLLAFMQAPETRLSVNRRLDGVLHT